MKNAPQIRRLLLILSFLSLIYGFVSVPAIAGTGRPNAEVGPTQVEISITITAMLTLIAYRFAIGATLPQISYLTRLDLFIAFSTLLVYASLVTVVVTAALSKKGEPEVAKNIDRVSRWGFPLFFVSSWIVSMFLPT